MITIEKLLNKKPIFLNDWKHKIDVLSDFFDINISSYEYNSEKCPYGNYDYWVDKKIKMEKLLKQMADVNILFASYGTGNYSGDAFVLFEKGGKLFEVDGSHCSCFGLENQWDPEETTIELLIKRLTDGKLGCDDYSDNIFHTELKEFLEVTK